jgi:hypothetical protein
MTLAESVLGSDEGHCCNLISLCGDLAEMLVFYKKEKERYESRLNEVIKHLGKVDETLEAILTNN